MNREDIIRMAREAGIVTAAYDAGFMNLFTKKLERFAELVAAAERESMTKDGWRRCAVGQRTTQFCGMLEDAVKAEREECAKVCEQSDQYGEGPDCWDWHAKDYAACIRARGEK